MTETNKTINFIKIITAAGIAVMTVLRFFQFKSSYSITDSETAFFTDSGLLSYISLIVLLAGAALVLVLCLCEKTMYGSLDFNGTAIQGLGGLLAAASLAVSMPYVYKYFTDESAMSEAEDASAFMLPLFIANILMLVFLLVFIYGAFSKKNICEKCPVVVYLPCVWVFIFVVFNYVHNTLFVNRSENYLVVVSSVSILFALMAAAKNYAGFGNSTRVKPMVFWASVASMSSISYGLSDVLLKLCAVDRLKSVNIYISYIFLGVGLFIFSILLTYKFNPEPKPEKTKDSKETDKAEN